MTNLKDSKLYINRELSWLRFNTRVFDQAKKVHSPLLERLKFIAIYGTNLDEFYMIRVAGLKDLYSEGVSASGIDKLTPLEQLSEIRTYLKGELQDVEITFNEIFSKLENEGIAIRKFSELNQTLQRKAKKYFYDNIFPVIVPIAIDTTHPFPHLNNLSFGLVVKLSDGEVIKYALIRIPRILPRFVEISKGIYLPIGNLVENFISDIFPHHELISSTPFRVTRNADIDIEEEEADDFMEILEEGLKLRKKGKFVRLEIGKCDDSDLLQFLRKHIRINDGDIYEFSIPLNLGTLWQIVGHKAFSHLTLPNFKPKLLPPFDLNQPIISVIDKQDVMLFHPFESFDPVVKFIEEAAKDRDVLAIKMTLYRVGKDSPIVKSLIEASQEGKQVTAMVELRARFDEENNLHWAKALEEAGAHVIYGITGFKVHAKIALVIKRDKDGGLKQYVHLSSGNYNSATAKVYTDISLFSNNDSLTKDATRFFHHLTGFAKGAYLGTLLMAPTQIKQFIIKMIEEEIKKKEEGRIILKANAIIHPEVIIALYRASMAGVKIDLIVRGICAIRPKIKDVSENIRVISIIGKYLEHARIYYFKHSSPKIFIASADLMPRNLDRRVELMTPILDESISNKLYELLNLQMRDNVLAYELLSDGTYQKVEHKKGELAIDSHKFMEDFVDKISKTVKKVDSKEKLVMRLFKES